MDYVIIFKSSVLPLFLIVLVAFVYRRLFKPDIRQITDLTLTIFAPAFVFDALVKNRITVDMLYQPILFMVFLTCALMLLAHLAAKLVRVGNDERIALILACSMINVGNFGLPLIYFAFGETAQAHSFLYFTVFNIPLTTVAIFVSSKEKKPLKIWIDAAKIPLFHAMIFALVVSGMSIEVPELIGKSIALLGQAAIPLLIFILGLQLADIRLRLSYLKIVLLAVVIRLVVSPAVAYPILEFIGVSGVEQQVAIVQTSTPAALLPLMYAIRFNRSPDLLAAIILTTTILSGFTLTILIHLIS
jgi:predicted permease